MSSVLYPVGPQPPRVYWVRRLVVLGVPLLLILIIAVSCVGGGGGKKSPSAGSGPTTSPTQTQTSDPNAACVPGDLSATLAVDASDGIYQIGDTPTFTATITNVSASSCKFTSAPANEIWTVVSGADKFWTTAGCPAGTGSTTKSLAAGGTQKLTITWQGKRELPGCTHGSSAPVGTYVLRARLDGVKAQPAVFHFHNDTTQ
ncbi:MAG TPA: hypothetical protein VHE56_13090 [Mycobacteriales bacterium]|nr:hypothetical protein [Mycobacteriales bacterium]